MTLDKMKQSRLKAWRNLYIKGVPSTQIAQIYDCSRQSISQALNKMAEKTDFKALETRELQRFYRQFKEGKNYLMISLLSKGRVSVQELRKMIPTLIEADKAKPAKEPKQKNRHPEWLKLYRQGVPVDVIAKQGNVTNQAVYANLQKYGRKYRSKPVLPKEEQSWIALYLAGNPIKKIADKARTSTQKVSAYLRSQGVPSHAYPFSTDEILEFIRLYNEGKSTQEIAKSSKKDISTTLLLKILRKSGSIDAKNSRNTMGKQAYEHRLQDKSWRQVSADMGKDPKTGKYRSALRVLILAKSYAITQGLPWPIEKKKKQNTVATPTKTPAPSVTKRPTRPLRNRKRTDVHTEDLLRGYLAGRSISELAREYRVDRQTVYDRLEPTGYLKTAYRAADDPQMVRKILEMHDQKKSIRTISKETNLSRGTVARILQAHKRDSARRPTKNPEMIREIVQRYERGDSIRKIRLGLEIHAATVTKILVEHSDKYKSRKGKS